MYDGVFSTPKTQAGAWRIPQSDTALTLIVEWRAYLYDAKPDALVFSTKMGTPMLPNNVLRRFTFPACRRLGFLEGYVRILPETTVRMTSVSKGYTGSRAPGAPHAHHLEPTVDHRRIPAMSRAVPMDAPMTAAT